MDWILPPNEKKKKHKTKQNNRQTKGIKIATEEMCLKWMYAAMCKYNICTCMV